VPKLGSADRVLLISMSGDVDRTFEAAEAALSHGAVVSLLTNGEGGRVGALGIPKISLDLPSLAPFLCGTASYTATLAALALLVSDSGLPEETPDILSAVVERARAVATDWPLNPPGLRYLAVGRDLATADYGAAKIVEVGRAPIWTDDLEEFAHRQFWTFSPDELVIFLSLDELTAHYADAAAEALQEFGVRTAVISAADTEVRNASRTIKLPTAPPILFPLLAAIPLQIYAYLHGFEADLDPNRRLHLKEDRERFATSRKLTRRSLLGTGR
jgi:fructoselysine-6-P-deglycase FrlB-like protein